MAVIGRYLGYLFIQAPGTGCTAIAEKVLIPQLSGEHVPPLGEAVYGRGGRILVDDKHATVEQLMHYRLITPEDAHYLFKFATVRNPFDWLVSEYTKQRTAYSALLKTPESFVNRERQLRTQVRLALNHDFSEWVLLTHMKRFGSFGLPMVDRSRGGQMGLWTCGVDFVMRFERLQSDFAEALSHIGVRPIKIPVYNSTLGRRREYRPYYTSESRTVVEKAWAFYLERHRYSF